MVVLRQDALRELVWAHLAKRSKRGDPAPLPKSYPAGLVEGGSQKRLFLGFCMFFLCMWGLAVFEWFCMCMCVLNDFLLNLIRRF